MIGKIREIISNLKNIDGWKINEKRVISSELFFIKKNIDMNRAKKVHHFKVTLYRDFEDEGVKYRGSSTTNIYPTMDDVEIHNALEGAAFAAQFAKNKYYPLVKPSEKVQPSIDSQFAKAPISEWLPGLTEAIFKEDTLENGWINSAELFLNQVDSSIINSDGVDVSFTTYTGEFEFITNWQEDSEEIELYKNMKFADYSPEMIASRVKEMLAISKDKAIAKPTPALKSHTVLLTGEPVKEFLKYYYFQSNAQYVYEGVATAKIDENIQGDTIEGDTINLRLDPFMKNSTNSSPYDEEGYPLEEAPIFEKGKLLRYWGNTRYAYYLDIKPTGLINNIIVEGGSKSVKDFKREPHLELIAFSDFQMDILTGDFGGEIRLGWYFDGNTTIPVTGGSISGNIKELHQKMFLSKETQSLNNFAGPKTIQLFNVNVTGI